MDRAYASGAAGSAPSAPASPSIGYPTAGNPGSGTPATKPGPYWYHMITEELRKVITDANLTPDQTNLVQLKAALDALYGSRSPRLQGISASVAANALTLGLAAGVIDFRSSTLSNGTPNSRGFSSALSLVVPSGATLGTVNGQAARLAVLAIDNAGTVELAVVNLSGGNNLDETALISTTAITAGASANNVIYSTTARTNVPYRVAGFIDITEATAGTWATAPTTVQGQGGQALAALQSIGYGQTYQDLTASRAFSTTYYNTTGRPIFVSIWSTQTTGTPTSSLTINGVIVSEVTLGVSSANGTVQGIVPPGGWYSAGTTAGGVLTKWLEMR